MTPFSNEPPPRFPVEHWRLANGLRVVVQPDPRSPLVASMMCYDAGSRYDPPSRSGLAHFCEHLAFLGPRRAFGRTFQERIDSLGGLPQAVTTPDRLCFSAVFPHTALAAVLAVEAERMVCPLDPRDAGALDIQRRVLVEELHYRSRRRVRPVAFEHLHRALFHEGHPYHRPPAGQPDDIRALTSTDVEEFVAARFSPRRAVLVLAGGLSAEVAAGCVERTFGTLAAGAARARDAIVDSQPQPATQSRRVAADVAGTHALVAWSVDGLGKGDWYLASLLMRGLSAGRSSPLAEALVERAGLAREVRGHLVSMRDASTLAFAAAAVAGVPSERMERGLAEAIDRLLASGLSPAGLQRARKRAWVDHYLAIQKIERRADLCASLTCCLDAPERLETEPLRYLVPDRDALAAFASRLRQRQARASLSLIPRMEAA